MNKEQIDASLATFLSRFNQMCQNERKHFLYRDVKVNYESGSSIKMYEVTYRVKRKGGGWLVEAVSKSGFWVFKKKFPLFRISQANGQITFDGLFTSSIPPFEASLLDEKLSEYLEICKKQPRHVFTES